jgi:hypothetical protein
MSSRIEVIQNTDNPIPMVFESENKQVAFVTSGMVTLPAVGDRYKNNGTIYTISSISGSTIYTSSNSNEDPTTSSGTLTRITGAGDSSITFTSFTSSNLVDLTGAIVNMIIKKNKNQVDSLAIININAEIADPILSRAEFPLTKEDHTNNELGSYSGKIVITTPAGTVTKTDSFLFIIKN